jgi:hypothetical protein
MRFITTGVGADGKSCVVSIAERESTGAVWQTPSVPPDLGYKRSAGADSEPYHGAAVRGLAPGASQCTYVALAPNSATELHAVDSYSIVTLMGGTCVLRLETGEIALGVGDIVTVPAIMHQWRAGPAGCQFSSMRFGIN